MLLLQNQGPGGRRRLCSGHESSPLWEPPRRRGLCSQFGFHFGDRRACKHSHFDCVPFWHAKVMYPRLFLPIHVGNRPSPIPGRRLALGPLLNFVLSLALAPAPALALAPAPNPNPNPNPNPYPNLGFRQRRNGLWSCHTRFSSSLRPPKGTPLRCGPFARVSRRCHRFTAAHTDKRCRLIREFGPRSLRRSTSFACGTQCDSPTRGVRTSGGWPLATGPGSPSMIACQSYRIQRQKPSVACPTSAGYWPTSVGQQLPSAQRAFKPSTASPPHPRLHSPINLLTSAPAPNVNGSVSSSGPFFLQQFCRILRSNCALGKRGVQCITG